MVLEKTLESPLDCKEIQPVHSKGDQSWVFIGSTDAEAETPILWPPHEKNWLIWKDPDAGKDWEQEEKGMTEDEMVGWHHWLDRLEFEWWWTGRPGVLRFMGSQRVGHNWVTDWTKLNWRPLKAKTLFPNQTWLHLQPRVVCYTCKQTVHKNTISSKCSCTALNNLQLGRTTTLRIHWKLDTDSIII